MKILYLHTCPYIGGSSRSICFLYNELKNYNIEGIILTSKGEVEKYFNDYKFKVYKTFWVSQFDNTEYGYYRGVRWLVLLREIIFFPLALFKIIKIVKKEKIKLVHLNEGNLFIYSLFLKKFFSNIKIILHIRAVQCKKRNFRKKIFNIIADKYIDKIICIDERVKNSLDEILFKKTSIIHNGIKYYNDIKDYLKLELYEEYNKKYYFGFIGVLYKAKGIDIILKTFNILINKYKINNIKLIIAGKNSRIFKNKILKKIFEFLGIFFDMEKYIIDYIKENELDEYVEFRGFVNNPENFYKDIDILLFTTNLYAIGRPVFEAASFGLPSIVTLKEPIYEDEIIDSKNGFVINELNEEILVKKIMYIINNKEILKEVYKNVYKYFINIYDIKINAEKLFEIYKSLI